MKQCAERHRADAKQRVPLPQTDDESDEFGDERKTGPRPRRPSPALACVARYREKYLSPEAAAVLKAMDATRQGKPASMF